MKNIADFKIQLSLLGMKPRADISLEEIFEKYQKLNEAEHSSLWEFLEPEKTTLEWPEREYLPEKSLQKRALSLGEEVIEELASAYPTTLDFQPSDSFNHLIQ
ncbi:MAG: hypothetical protein HQL32_18215, partial [Planctomycetes bacterium]|nr:hypothetical protein [Planctomycetota bacterium]